MIIYDTKKMKHRKKIYFVQSMEYFQKKGSNWQTQTPFLGEAMYVSFSKWKIEIGNKMSELNPKLWKTGVLPQTLSQSPRVLNRKILQQVIYFGSLSMQTEKMKN